MRAVKVRSGQRYYLCQNPAIADKYPRQPVTTCPGYHATERGEPETTANPIDPGGRVSRGRSESRPVSWGVVTESGQRGETAAARPIDPGVDIGHVHLKVADIDRALGFWRDVLGFEVQEQLGDHAAFLSAGGYHHHIGLNTWESKRGSPPSRGTTGLYHVAVRYPTRAALAGALRRVLEAGIRLDGASDHGVSEALYLRDFDGNGVELYWDRPREQWPRLADGRLAMVTEPLDVRGLLAEPEPDR
jgi:catechol 2,3-dioxygenase